MLYFSVHRFEHGSFWPNLRESDFHNIGEGPGKGYNVNVPLNQTRMANADYFAIWHQLLLPMAYEVYSSRFILLRVDVWNCQAAVYFIFKINHFNAYFEKHNSVSTRVGNRVSWL